MYRFVNERMTANAQNIRIEDFIAPNGELVANVIGAVPASEIPTQELFEFSTHPFEVGEGLEMCRLRESIKEQGILTPGIARPRSKGGYEILSGHRRVTVARELNILTVPMIIIDVDDDAAMTIVIRANYQRSKLEATEKAKVFEQEFRLRQHQGRSLGNDFQKSSEETNEIIGKIYGLSGRMIRNYRSLVNLIPPLQNVVNKKKISIGKGAELSRLSHENQEAIIKQAKALNLRIDRHSIDALQKQFKMQKDYATDNQEELLVKREDLVIPAEELDKYYPENVDNKEIYDEIIVFFGKKHIDS